MEDYEIKPENIFRWAENYASYEELEYVAKNLYGQFVQWRKREYPDEHKKAKEYQHKKKRLAL